MLEITKEALKIISDRSYSKEKGLNYFNLLIEYCLKVVPIIETEKECTASVGFRNNGFVIFYNPKCDLLIDGADTEEQYIERIATFLAHEALHILFRHVGRTQKPGNYVLRNVAEDAQINSYLWRSGYYDAFKQNLHYYTIYDFIDLINKIKEKHEQKVSFEQELEEFLKTGSFIGFKSPDDLPSSEAMYELLCDNEESISKVEEILNRLYSLLVHTYDPCIDVNSDEDIDMNNVPIVDGKDQVVSPGILHSEFEVAASGIFVDRIFKGFSNATKVDLSDFNEKIGKMFDCKNPFFVMKRMKQEKLKPEWKRILGKCISGVNVSSEYKQTWSRFSRRLGEGYPGRTRDKYQECSIMIDVSGSMTEDIPRALNQLCEIATFMGKIKYVLTWDTEQCNEWFNINTTALKKLNIGARGGTSLGGGFEQLARKGRTKLLIIISDMETSKEDYDILNSLSKSYKIILGLVQRDIKLKYKFLDNSVKVIPIGGIPDGCESDTERAK